MFLAGIVLWMNTKEQDSYNLVIGLLCILNSIYLPFVNGYAVDITLYMHFKRALKGGKFKIKNNNFLSESKPEKSKLVYCLAIHFMG